MVAKEPQEIGEYLAEIKQKLRRLADTAFSDNVVMSEDEAWAAFDMAVFGLYSQAWSDGWDARDSGELTLKVLGEGTF